MDPLQEFTNRLEELMAEANTDYRCVVERGKPLLANLIKDMSWLEPKYSVTPSGESIQYLLAEHPTHAYVVVSVVFPGGYRTPIHDHGTWGLVGVWQGEEQEERFAVTPVKGRPDYVDLRSVGFVSNGPGTVTHLLQPNEEVHRIFNPLPSGSRSIHVYGGNMDGRRRRQFDPDTGRVKEYVTRLVRPI